MTTEIFNDAVEIQGSQDAVQLRVQGHSQQTDSLQSWEDQAGTPLARMTGDGRLEIGDLTVGAPDALLEVNNNLTLPTSEPLQGIQSHGRVSGAISNAIAWMVSELELLGTGGISGLHTALRGKLIHNNMGDTSNAELRAGDFEIVNQSGTASLPVGQVMGLQSTVTNQESAYVDEAVGVEIGINNAGDIQKAYGLRVDSVNQATNENYAIHTAAGSVHVGDDLELKVFPSIPSSTPPGGFLKLYPKIESGEPKLYVKLSDGQEHAVSGGSGSSGGDANDITYIPAAASDWNNNVDPGNVDDALDQLADRLDALENLPGASIARDHNGNYTTVSSSFVDVDSTNLSITLSLKGTKAFVYFVGLVAAGTGAAMLDFSVNGTRVGSAGVDGIARIAVGNTINNQTVTLCHLVTGLTPGQNIFKLQWRSNGGTATLFAGAGGGIDQIPVFGAYEVP